MKPTLRQFSLPLNVEHLLDTDVTALAAEWSILDYELIVIFFVYIFIDSFLISFFYSDKLLLSNFYVKHGIEKTNYYVHQIC